MFHIVSYQMRGLKEIMIVRILSRALTLSSSFYGDIS